MFDKRKENAHGEARTGGHSDDSFSANPTSTGASRRSAMIGPGIRINGDISGDENIVIEGEVKGNIKLDSHQVEIGQSGKVNADVTAKTVNIAGQVEGDITGQEKVTISKTGNVRGNIVAPRLTLEDGAKFKGSIDMDPGENTATELPLTSAKKPAAKANGNAPAVVSESKRAGTGQAAKSG